MTDTRPTIGLDVGGTKIAGALVAADGTIGARARVPSPAHSTDAIVAQVAEVVAQLRAAADADGVRAVGLACAAFVDGARGHVWSAPNLAWRDIDLRSRVEDVLDLPVVIENDATAAAWGEHLLGAGRGSEDLLLLTLGTGVGSGIVAGGRLLTGAAGVAGEVGHVILDPDGPLCGCGNRGCLEVYASGTALTRQARALVASGEPGSDALRGRCGDDPARLTGVDVTDLAEGGDPASNALLAEVGRRLGHGIAAGCAVLDPGVVVVGGGLSAAGELVLEPARRAFEERRVGRGSYPAPQVVRAVLGDDAGVVGVARLAAAAIDHSDADDRHVPEERPR